MKTQTQKEITLEIIAEILATHSLSDARAHLADRIGEQMKVFGTVLKVIKRSGLKLHLQTATSAGRTMQIFADFPDERRQQRVKQNKIRNNSTVALTGKFESFGSAAVVLGSCWLPM